MRRIILLVFLLPFVTLIDAQNPIVPPGMYIADPEAHVWKDGKIYVYGSRDECNDYWCSYQHHVLSSSDLKNWTIVENSFASKGKNDQVLYHDKLLFAPDCAYKNGTYYLYYCSPGNTMTEGVATSSSPFGPFVGGSEIKGAYQIDPAVLVDDDGQGYFFWGQGKPKVAKLKPNMREIDESTITEPLDSAGNIAFHEGSSIRKIGALYYFVFADDSRDQRPTCLGYATSKYPMGPYTYKGIIIDNKGCDPSDWNNHGSIQSFHGQWYVFYHRSTHNSQKFRKACIEPIKIARDGTIAEVEMTTQGASKPMDARETMDAARACRLSGSLYISNIESTDKKNEGLINISDGDFAEYKYLNFGKGVSQFEVKTQNDSSGEIEIRIDSPDGKLVGTCEIKKSTSEIQYQISHCSIQKTTGIHALYLKFRGKEGKLFDVDWFTFL